MEKTPDSQQNLQEFVVIDEICRNIPRPQARQTVFAQRSPPTGVQRVGKEKMRLREIEGDAPVEMAGDGPPLKIQVARVVSRDQRVL